VRWQPNEIIIPVRGGISDVIINSPCVPSEQTGFCCCWWVHLWCVYFVWCALRSLVSLLRAAENQFVSRGTRVHHNRDQGCILFLSHTETHSHTLGFCKKWRKQTFVASRRQQISPHGKVTGCVFTLGVVRARPDAAGERAAQGLARLFWSAANLPGASWARSSVTIILNYSAMFYSL
jgi:hypothetical protein